MKKSIKLCSLGLAACVLMASCNGTGKSSASDTVKGDTTKLDTTKADASKVKADTDSAKKDSVPVAGSPVQSPQGPDHPPGK